MSPEHQTFKPSPIVWGHWRLPEWKLSPQALLYLTKQCIELGVDTIDSADIYGVYTCESSFGQALALEPSLRQKFKIITKCGIRLLSAKFPDVKVKHYDYSFRHIVGSVDRSLRNFRTDYIDLLLLHRPSPMLDPAEVANAFEQLKRDGKVLNFGVSNFLPYQVDMLQSHLDMPLVVNQIEISPLHVDCFQNGTIDYMLRQQMIPMAWSPLAGGRLFNPKSLSEKRVLQALQQVAFSLGSTPEQVAIGWLLSHPAGIVPVIGTGNIGRIKSAAEAVNINLTLQDWFLVYSASLGREVD